MTGNPQRDIEIFTEAMQLPDAERVAYLERACADDEGLRQRIEALLRSNDRAGDFLEQPPTGSLSECRAKIAAGEKPGDRVGRYKLLQQIGEGGCGVVFMAEQEEPVRRRVALKVIKLGMDTKSVIARFEAERQGLAMMGHSNIAKVFDAGATEAGRPFFVMELVRGIKITYYCDQNNLSTRERLELFIQVCQAVQHAHQKGVIHRDIKPSNILVTARDGVPVPKVIDFGIAKATTDQPLTNKTLFTAFEQFLGTPAYMSPEQAEMSELGMDTRSDIYSLGVLLYELLTGHTPFDAAELLRAGIDSMRRTIRETDPPRPSTRLSTMLEADLTTAAKCRHSDPLKLIHLVRGDLDWIVMKCLEKDRMRRYETANGLATDVHRYLRNEPVVARPPSTAYRFPTLVWRNKLAFAAAAALSTMLVIGTVVSTLEAIRATSSEREQSRLRQAAQQAQASESKLRQKAEANEKRAESEALKSRQVASFLEEMLGSVDPAVARGRDTTLLRRILDRTADRVRHDLTNQVEVQAELLRVCGHVYWSIGEDLKSEAAYRQALAIQRTVFGKENAAVADTLFGLAQTLCYLRPKESEGYYRESLEIRRKLYGNENSLVAHCLNNITSPLLEQGKFAEAESFSREALAMERKLLSNDLAAAAGQTNSDLALAWKERALARGEDELAVSLRDLGIVLRSAAKLGEAESSLREGLALFRRVVGDRHPDVAFTLDALAKVLSDEGKLAEAEIAGREAMAIQRDVYRTESPALRNTFFGLIHILRKEGKLAEAESLTRELLAERRKLLGNDNPEVATFLGQLADLLKAEGRLVEAETAGREAFALKIKLSANDSSVAESLSRLIKQLMAQRKYADVEQLFREILPPSADDQPQRARKSVV